MVDFDIQSFLQDMREDLNKRHDALGAKMDMFASSLHQHQLDDAKALAALDARLATIEGAYRNVKWVARTGYTAIAAVVTDFAVNHLPTWIRGVRP